MELTKKLAQCIGGFVSKEGDVVELSVRDGKAMHRFKLRECVGTTWYPWHPTENLVDYDHVRQIIIDRGWGFSQEYCPLTKLYTFNVIIRLTFYSAINKDRMVAACSALLAAIINQKILEEKYNDSHSRQKKRSVVERNVHTVEDNHDQGCCGANDERCCDSSGRCSCKT